MRRFTTTSFCGHAGLTLFLAMLPLAGIAGNFGVSPIRVDLDRNSKSGAITVSNDEEAAPLRMQLKLFEWTQDAAGKDEYQPSDDLLYFPRVMTLDKGESKLVRVGLRTPALAQERTYRLFIEELPPPLPPGVEGGARIAIAIRFGVPIFVKPAKEEVRGEIEKVELAKGVLRVGVRNTGNVHFRISSVAATTGASFAKEAPGWYLLAGAVRDHTIELPAAACEKSKRLEIIVKTDRPLELKGTLDVSPSMCKR